MFVHCCFKFVAGVNLFSKVSQYHHSPRKIHEGCHESTLCHASTRCEGKAIWASFRTWRVSITLMRMLIKLRFHKYLRNLCVFSYRHVLPHIYCHKFPVTDATKRPFGCKTVATGFFAIVNKAQRDVFLILNCMGLCVRRDEQINEQRIALFPRKWRADE